MIWYFLRITMSFAFPVFFRRMKIKNARRIREKGPMFIAMNHPNAFVDPMAFSWMVFHPRTRYMARGDAFKKGFARWALESMGVVPIFRLRDGGLESVKKNLDSFEIAYDLLDKKQKIMVFAEGVCIQERRLRTIQKGTAKMAFAYLDRGGHADLKIIPVGVNYSMPGKIRGDFFVQIGEPILVKDYYEEYKKSPAQTIIKLTALIQEKLTPLVPSLLHKENDLLNEQLQPILKKQFIVENKLNFGNLEYHQKYWEFIIARLNSITENFPEQIIGLRKAVEEYTKQIEELKIGDEVILVASKGITVVTLINSILFLVGFPFYLLGALINVIPYYLGKRIADKTVKGAEFYSSVFFGSSALLAKLFFTIELVVVWFLCHDICCLPIYAAIKIGCGIIAIAYSPFKKKLLSGLRFNNLKRSNHHLFQSLLQQRAKILAFIGDFH